jgi:hypothetical protein
LWNAAFMTILAGLNMLYSIPYSKTETGKGRLARYIHIPVFLAGLKCVLFINVEALQKLQCALECLE